MRIMNESLLMHLETKEYPLDLNQIKQRHPDITFPQIVDEAFINALGYVVVDKREQPTADVVQEVTPIQIGNRWSQKWIIRDFTTQEKAENLEKKKKELLAKLKEYRTQKFAYGVSYRFPTSMDVKHIQIRDGDRSNLNTLYIRAKEEQHYPEGKTFFFITRENEVFSNLSAATIIDMCDHTERAYSSIVLTLRKIKDKILSASRIEDLPTIPDDIPDDFIVVEDT